MSCDASCVCLYDLFMVLDMFLYVVCVFKHVLYGVWLSYDLCVVCVCFKCVVVRCVCVCMICCLSCVCVCMISE